MVCESIVLRMSQSAQARCASQASCSGQAHSGSPVVSTGTPHTYSCRAVPVSALPGLSLSWSSPRAGTARQRLQPLRVSASELGNLVESEEEFKRTLKDNDVVVIDWMARWCRKCIYIKPKITKMMQEDYPGIPIMFIDVNAVPGNIVYDNGIRKMPTITIFKHGEKVREHIAAEGGSKAVVNIRQMIKDFVDEGGLDSDN